MVIIYNFLSLASFFVSNFIPFIRMLLMWSFHNFNCIFVHRIFFVYSSLYIVHGTAVSGQFFPGFFLTRWFLAMITFIEIRMGNVHLHSTRLCYLIVVLLLLFFALWNVSILCALLRASSIEWLRWWWSIQVVQMWIFFNSLFSRIRTISEFESMLSFRWKGWGEISQIRRKRQ